MCKKRNVPKALIIGILIIIGLIVLPTFAGAASSDDLTYEIINGEAVITACNKEASGRLSIPAKLGGYPVTRLGDSAFEYCRALTEVIIPNGVTDIGDNTFHRCSGLERVSIPEGVTSIGSLTFCDCVKLTDVNIPKTVKSIGNCAFFATALTNVTIPDNTEIIDTRAFECCYSLTDITIPENVTSIGEWAFAHCTALESVTIGKGIKSIGHGAFYECEAIKKTSYTGTLDEWTKIEFTNSRSNPMLYSKNFYINDSLVTNAVFKSATNINSFAFYNCDCLESVSLLEGTTSIDPYAFRYCSGLKNILIPKSVTNIGEEAFYHCYDLVISGYENSYAQRYAEENGVPFVAVSCTHPTSNRIVYPAVAASCEAAGTSQSIYCSQCGEWLQTSEVIPATGHTPTDWIVEAEPTCTKAGSKVIRCKACSRTLETEKLLATGHVDENTDGVCDVCGSGEKETCSCSCHKGGFTGFIWKIINLFNMIFGNDQYCACGAKHW